MTDEERHVLENKLASYRQELDLPSRGKLVRCYDLDIAETQ